MGKVKMPPIGLAPEYIFEDSKNMERLMKICGAISRYAEHEKPIPASWAEELTRRVKGFKDD